MLHSCACVFLVLARLVIWIAWKCSPIWNFNNTTFAGAFQPATRNKLNPRRKFWSENSKPFSIWPPASVKQELAQVLAFCQSDLKFSFKIFRKKLRFRSLQKILFPVQSVKQNFEFTIYLKAQKWFSSSFLSFSCTSEKCFGRTRSSALDVSQKLLRRGVKKK